MTGNSFLVTVLLAVLGVFQGPKPEPNPGDHAGYYASGQPGAPIRLEVFSDFQCPSCRTFYLDTMRQVMKDYANETRICVVYHDFPLPMHNYAREATRYSLAAQRMGKDYWLRMSDALYTDQARWAQDGKVDFIAFKILNPEEYGRLRRILQDPAINQAVEREIAAAAARKVESTPTFFLVVNGREQKVVGGVTYPTLKNYLDRLLK